MSYFASRGPRPARRRGVVLRAELLEDRATPAALTPAQVLHAYGFDQVSFTNSSGAAVAADGAGQTIAIVDAYDDPYIAADLATFDAQYGIAAPPSFTKVTQTGTVANAGWAGEIALDVEWAHAIAPKANILLVEANSSSLSSLLAAVDYARSYPGVTAVSMSWGGSEFSSEASYDSHFTTPAGHAGVTFVASSGDAGAPASWPAASPRVVGVGGTHLVLNTDSSWNSETGWSGSGGGVSAYESKPGYQSLVTTGSSKKKSSPDVAYDADPYTGFAVYDHYSGGWVQVGGTSAGAPQWAALVAIANEGRALRGLSALDGPSQTLYALYKEAQLNWSSYYHDVTSGSNGTVAGAKYDTVTGLGSPVANKVIAALVSWTGSGSTGTITQNAAAGSGGTLTQNTIRHAVTVVTTTTAASAPTPVAVPPVSPAPVVVPTATPPATPAPAFAAASGFALPPVGYAYTGAAMTDARPAAPAYVPPLPWLPIPSGNVGPDVPGFDDLRKFFDPDTVSEEAGADPLAGVELVEVAGVEVDR